MSETIRIPCAGCGENIPTRWAQGGGLLRSQAYTLVGDYVFHTECWDKLVAEHPPGEDDITEDRRPWDEYAGEDA